MYKSIIKRRGSAPDSAAYENEVMKMSGTCGNIFQRRKRKTATPKQKLFFLKMYTLLETSTRTIVNFDPVGRRDGLVKTTHAFSEVVSRHLDVAVGALMFL